MTEEQIKSYILDSIPYPIVFVDADHANEVFLGVSVCNHRIYINPVRDENGELVGYFERFEMNIQK